MQNTNIDDHIKDNSPSPYTALGTIDNLAPAAQWAKEESAIKKVLSETSLSVNGRSAAGCKNDYASKWESDVWVDREEMKRKHLGSNSKDEDNHSGVCSVRLISPRGGLNM